MPTDSQYAPVAPAQPNHYLVGLVVGAFLFATLSLVCSQIGLEAMETIIFAALTALTVGVLVCRERASVYELALAKWQHLEQLSLEGRRLDELYMNSVAGLVMFEASTLVIDRVSSGFFDLLGVSVDEELVGARLGEVLGVDSAHLASVVHQIKVGTISVREELECKRFDGQTVTLFLSGRYMPHLHMVEAAFCYFPSKLVELPNYQHVVDDLERFKNGIVRRESRVLELKGEVNQLLREAKQSERYQVDAMSDDSRFYQQTLKTKEGAKYD